MFNLTNPPAQKAYATLLDKGEYISGDDAHRFALFEFADGTRHALIHPSSKVYKSLEDGQTGVVFFTVSLGAYTLEAFDRNYDEPDLPSLLDPPPAQADTLDEVARAEAHSKRVVAILLFVGLAITGWIFLRLLLITRDTTHARIIFSIAILIPLLSFATSMIKRRRFKSVPEQQLQATIVERAPHQHFVFSFEAERSKSIEVPTGIYITHTKGDTGLLTFKERNGKYQFIDFTTQK